MDLIGKPSFTLWFLWTKLVCFAGSHLGSPMSLHLCIWYKLWGKSLRLGQLWLYVWKVEHANNTRRRNHKSMTLMCTMYNCGIFPRPTSWKLLWHDGNQHLLNYDAWLVVHACMIRVHFLHLMSFPPITDVKFSSQNILFYFIYQPTPIINKMHVKRWVRNQNTYQNSKGEKNNQPKPCSGKFVQNWIWAKGKLARKC